MALRWLQLLSSSMDKTVRLWDTESKACLKTFAHSDYGEQSH
jgi:WD40 repeat protein